jgi:hypothetical protein
MPGEDTSNLDVLERVPDGFWLALDGERLFLSFTDFPWFRDVTLQGLRAVVRPSADHLYWPALDIDLSVASIRDPAAFPLVAAR